MTREVNREDVFVVLARFPNPKNLKLLCLKINQELRDKLKQMERKQDSTNAVLANVLSLIQNRFVGEDVNDILRAARQVTNASSAPTKRILQVHTRRRLKREIRSKQCKLLQFRVVILGWLRSNRWFSKLFGAISFWKI
ncbi:hypothetical protein QL285_043192 [Trifolium repens]|nr:hypothetical protein QL285_043192 [Trifolium repens]